MLILGAEIGDRANGVERATARCMDLRCENGRISELAAHLVPRPGERVIEARGGALIPGLHDHHLHLLSLAADLASLPCGPPQVESRAALADVLRRAQPVSGWLRGTGYFESVAGPLDRSLLDALAPALPLRIQHRSGSMWFLNSRAIEALGLEHDEAAPGIERDAAGRATGRLFRADGWLRERLPSAPAPDLAAVGRLLARRGVTAVTDATPSNGPDEAAILREAQRTGALPQRIRLMGELSLSRAPSLSRSNSRVGVGVGVGVESDEWLTVDACKILLDEPALPDLDRLVSHIRAAHEAGRGVAIHCVTRTEIYFALAALEAAGTREGDRLEHASVSPPECLDRVKRLGIAIVTQPNFVSERGDAYRDEVDARDLPHLYRVRSWLDAGVAIAGGTDAPFGRPDPWSAMQAAVRRETRSGAILGEAERVSPEVALSLFTKPFGPAACDGPAPTTPGDAIAIGRRADLCLLDAPWRALRDELSSERVVATVCGGELIWPEAP